MLSILHPEIIPLIHDLRLGLIPIVLDNENLPKLIVKASKEILLTAKVNQGFKIYVAPLVFAGKDTLGLISAFFDDEDEPLIIRTPLFNDEVCHQLLEILSSGDLDVHFFDEHNRELLGYTSRLECLSTTRDLLTNATLCSFSLDLAKSADTQMQLWFGVRTSSDDYSAMNILFLDALMPDDVFIMDARPTSHLFQGCPQSSFSVLEREEPGRFQEQDIAHALGKVFPSQSIYMNPLRVSDNEELTDILVLTESRVIVIQAKDSPNTERVLANSLERKRSTTRKALAKAIDQSRGAVRYLRLQSPVKMIVGGDVLEVDITGRELRILIVVKELFNDEYAVYSKSILDLSQQTQVPCISLDYPELYVYTTGLSDEESFIAAFDRVFFHGLETGMFPRLRIW